MGKVPKPFSAGLGWSDCSWPRSYGTVQAGDEVAVVTVVPAVSTGVKVLSERVPYSSGDMLTVLLSLREAPKWPPKSSIIG